VSFDKFIYGKDQTAGVVSVEIDRYGTATLYTEDGEIHTDNEYWILFANRFGDDSIRLKGDLHYSWAEKFDNARSYQSVLNTAKAQNLDYYVIYNQTEQFLIKSGVTYYKGLEPKDVSVMSFDIETTGLNSERDKVLLISNTFRRGATIERKLFSYDDYSNEREMIHAWCKYIRICNPSVLLGHNIFNFDLPFLKDRGGPLELGRDGSVARFSIRPSQFRKDGSQSYDYKNVLIHGREIIDTFHLAIKFDVGRKYPSYGLKAIIKHEGLERADRQHFDAATIKDVYENATEWAKIKQYAEHDADDSLALYDLMIPAYFYYAQSIPKTMQQIINTATGSQINAFLVRSYISEGHSIPKASQPEKYQGAISYGNAGVYKGVQKFDVASLYPSIMLEYKVDDKQKDPNGFTLRMVETFTNERLKNKELARTTGERKYKELSDAQKIVINSAYGFMGAPGLNFNNPAGAATVTRHGRQILTDAIAWCEGKGYSIVNVDTDSISYSIGRPVHPRVYEADLAELNTYFPEMIRWEDDGFYKKVIVVKAKNYVLQDEKGNVTIKGSGLKATMKEPALRQFINDTINLILEDKRGDIRNLYMDSARGICNIDVHKIQAWSSRKTITKAVLNPERTNEQRIKDAVGKRAVQEGDKINVFFKSGTELSMVEDFDGTYDVDKLLEKLYKTIKILEPILDMSEFPNFKLKKNKELLEELKNEKKEWPMVLGLC